MLNAGLGPPPLPPDGAEGDAVHLGPAPPFAPPNPQQLPLPPPAGAGLLPIVGHFDYAARYQDASTDPYNGDYAGLMNVFDVPAQGQATGPAQLITQVADSTVAGAPTAFLLLVANPSNPAAIGRIMCFHRVTKFPARLGSPSHWDNNFFAFSGNNSGPQVTTIAWRNDYFAQVNGGALIRIPTEQQADLEVSLAPPVDALGPYNNNDAGTETIRTRRAMVVPPKYIRLFLDAPLSPIRAYQLLRAATTVDGTTAALLPLSVWLRAAMTLSAGNAPSAVQGSGPTAPLADRDLHRFTWQSLTSDLPSVDPGTRANSGLQAVAVSLGTLVHEQRAARQDAARARDASSAPKGVETLFRTRLSKLMRLCRVNNNDDLPPVYTELANCKAKDTVQTMQDAIDFAAQDLHLGDSLVMTPALSKKILNVAWAMTSIDDIESGIHHFHVVQQSPEGMAAARHLVATHDLLHTEGTNLSLEDAERLASIQNASIPLTWPQARHTIGNLIVLCHVFLGAAHPLTLGLLTQFTLMAAKEVHLEYLAPPTSSTVPRHLLPAYFIRWNQLRFHQWFKNQQVSHGPIAVPVFNQILDNIELRQNWLPDFPTHFLPAAFLPAPTRPSPVSPSSGGRDQPSTANRTPASLAPSPTADRPANAIADNASYKETVFGRFKSMPGCTMAALRARWMAATPPVESPKTADGSRRRCLPYHVKGMCNSVCRKANDHVPGSETDDQILLTFCTAHWHL